jgi:hypothetical protein
MLKFIFLKFFKLFGYQSNLTLYRVVFLDLKDYIYDDQSFNKLINFTECVFKFSEAFSRQEIFRIDLSYSILHLKSTKFLIAPNQIFGLKYFINSYQQNSKVFISDVSLDYEKLSPSIIFHIIDGNVLKINNISFRGYKGRLLELAPTGVDSKPMNIEIKRCYFELIEMDSHFIILRSAVNLTIISSNFYTSKNQIYALVYSDGLVKTESLIVLDSQFFNIKERFPC